jgi:DNA topoisomerase-1
MPDEPIEAYCVKCRQRRPIASAQPVFFGGQNRPATRGVCPECGTALTRFGATPAHAGLEPPPPGIVEGAAQDGAPPKKVSRKAARQAASPGAAEAAPSPRKPAKKAARKPPAAAEPGPEQRASGPKMVIVESPAKARTVARFLGQGYAVEASVGHVRDLPQNRMGVDIEAGFVPRYVIPARKKEVVDRLRAKAQRAAELYLATDPDREGEAIAWHLATALEKQVRGIPVHRVEFHEITDEAVEQAFAHPRDIDQLRVDAQQARRILDRVVGYTLSPLLRDKVGRKNVSAGRVQSVALRLICEREREIQAFVPVEYWTIEAELSKRQQESDRFIARLIKIRGKEPDLKDQAGAQAVLDDLAGAAYVVHKVTRQDRRRYPSPPFMTSTLQQEASRKLGYTAKRTMAIAQALYEGKDIGGERAGLITYMRTDSLNVAASAQAEAARFIQEHYGPSYLPAKPPHYRSPKTAQEAHEAIRPTAVRREPASLKAYLSREELQLYTLIWKRFVASQMAPAILDQTVVDVLAGREGQGQPYLFRATGSVVKFPGFLRVYGETYDAAGKEEEGAGVRLPDLAPDELLDLIRLLPKQHFTEPPPRYTDASLIRALEEHGIGRPSTYAPILATLLERQYVDRVAKQLIPTEIGFLVNDQLVAFFSGVVNVAFTAAMEEKLDRIAVGEQAWVPMLQEFYGPFAVTVEQAQANMPHVELKPEPTGEMCPDCGQPLVYRRGRFGKFISCSGWPACKYKPQPALPGVVCPVCGGAVVERRGRRGRKFYGCANWRPNDETACKWTSARKPQNGSNRRAQ